MTHLDVEDLVFVSHLANQRSQVLEAVMRCLLAFHLIRFDLLVAFVTGDCELRTNLAMLLDLNEQQFFTTTEWAGLPSEFAFLDVSHGH